jgi:hypothetical protein
MRSRYRAKQKATHANLPASLNSPAFAFNAPLSRLPCSPLCNPCQIHLQPATANLPPLITPVHPDSNTPGPVHSSIQPSPMLRLVTSDNLHLVDSRADPVSIDPATPPLLPCQLQPCASPTLQARPTGQRNLFFYSSPPVPRFSLHSKNAFSGKVIFFRLASF